MSTPLAPVIQALRFDHPETSGLFQLDERILHWCDRAQLTLELGFRCSRSLPGHLRDRIHRNMESNRERTRRLELHLGEALSTLSKAGLDPIVLKGFAHSPEFVTDPARRPQYDIDLWLPYDEAVLARSALSALGYEPLDGREQFPTDHLPVLVRKTGYRWRGDWYDPDIPPMIDLHFRLWDPLTEAFEVPGWESFRDRRIRKQSDTCDFAAMEPVDALGFAAMHALRHVLRGAGKVYNLYEIAAFLQTRADDHGFWERWRTLHCDSLRRVEAIVFAMAQTWFGCRLPESCRLEAQALPANVRSWLDRYALAPLEGLFHPNKHELWLHLELIEGRREAVRVLRRRLLPMRAPQSGGSTTLLPESQVTWRVRLDRHVWRISRITQRAWHHTRVLPSVMAHGLPWLLQRSGVQPGFLRYLAATSFFAAGVFVFFVLYNLHLLALGFRENFLGQVSAAMTLGSIAGTLPAGWLGARFGLRPTLIVTIVAVAVVSALRAVFVTPASLLGMAFAEGLFLSGWAVQALPAVSEFTTPESRTRGFSLMAIFGISMGVVGGRVGGHLPAWVSAATGSPLRESRYFAILLGSAIVALALIPAWKLRFQKPAVSVIRSYPTNSFMFRFFGALALWQFATGTFKPFFNAWLARYLHASDAAVGDAFSLGQLTQVLALIAAPFVLRRMGVIPGVAAMMMATGLSLCFGSTATSLPWAALGYILYMAAQYMSEPGMFTLLMNGVPEAQRSGASSMNFLIVYATHALAALAGGSAFAAFGYPPVMMVSGGLAVLGGWLFWRVLREGGADPAKRYPESNR